MADRASDGRRWLTPPVAGIGAASMLSDVGHEVPTALLPSFLTSTLGAPAAALGLIEGIADGGAGVAKLIGGGLADDPGRRRVVAVGGYATTAVLSGAVGIATGAWVARGIRGPSRNALLADAVPASAYGRAFGFERAMDNLGAIAGPLLAIGLVAATSARTAIVLSTIPGLMAATAMWFAVRRIREQPRAHVPFRVRVRPVLRGELGRILVGAGAFEMGNLAATLMILRATELLEPSRGAEGAATTALWLYVAYNVAATLSSVPAGRVADRTGPVRALAAGVSLFLVARPSSCWRSRSSWQGSRSGRSRPRSTRRSPATRPAICADRRSGSWLRDRARATWWRAAGPGSCGRLRARRSRSPWRRSGWGSPSSSSPVPWSETARFITSSHQEPLAFKG
jgi:MFS family permease